MGLKTILDAIWALLNKIQDRFKEVQERTHWVIRERGEDLLAGADFEYIASGLSTSYFSPIELKGNTKYIVVMNGIEYECLSFVSNADGVPFIALGNIRLLTSLEGEDTGEPFLLLDFPVDIDGVYGVAYFTEPLSKPLSVMEAGKVHQIDKKFIPPISYKELTDKPTIPEEQVQADWWASYANNPDDKSVIKNRPPINKGSGNNGLQNQGSYSYGDYAVSFGYSVSARGDYQFAQGKYNVEDNADKYAHIVGNGDYTKRSNAYALDWDGNAYYKGKVYVEGTNDDATGGKELATKEYVDNNSGGITLDKMTQIISSANYDGMTADQNGISWNDTQEVYAEGEEGAVANVAASFNVPIISGDNVTFVVENGKVKINAVSIIGATLTKV